MGKLRPDVVVPFRPSRQNEKTLIDRRPSANDLRRREIDRLRNELETADFPRLKMMLIVGLTGAGGFLASYLLLGAGMASMTSRYPLAVGIAYLVFLFLLWLWLRSSADDYSDFAPDLPDGGHRSAGNCSGEPSHEVEIGDSANGLGDVVEAASGADEFAIPLLVLIVIAALVLASGWIVYSAPLLFAELLVDGVLAASLYRRLKGIETRHWLETAVRRTAWPFALTALTFCLAGAVMHGLAPGAHSIGEFLSRAG